MQRLMLRVWMCACVVGVSSKSKQETAGTARTRHVLFYLNISPFSVTLPPSLFYTIITNTYTFHTITSLSARPPTPEPDELVVQAFQMMQSPHADAVKIHKQFLKVSADASTLTCHITQPTPGRERERLPVSQMIKAPLPSPRPFTIVV